MAIFPSSAIPSAAADFTIDQSLRFNSASTSYLNWTPTGASNRKTWTFSCWFKGANTATAQTIFTADNGSNSSSTIITLKPEGFIQVWQNGNKPYFTTNALYRDPSAWYNLVVALDTTQGTEADRFKMYVNGEQITSFDNDTYPDEDQEPFINGAGRHDIGNKNYIGAASEYLDNYLAEVHFIDGTALTQSSFGETGDYGEWKPKQVSGLTYGTNGFYLSFAGGGVMSATGGDSIGTDGDYKYNTFLSDGTFTPSADGYVEYLVVGGGGAGAGGPNWSLPTIGGGSGGGGAGAMRTGYLAVTASTAYSITVGDGGTGATYASAGRGEAGDASIFSSITSGGGGGGCSYGNGAYTIASGSGGGGMGKSDGTASTGGVSTAHGNDGGDGGGTGTTSATSYGGGAGGGAGAVGGDGSSTRGGDGGAGLASSITGSAVTYAGGGAGSSFNDENYQGTGAGSGSLGGNGGVSGGMAGGAGATNKGGGGGGASKAGSDSVGGSGGSGIVILRYKFQ